MKQKLKRIRPKDIPGITRGVFGSFGREIGEMRGTNVWVFIMYGLLFDMGNNLWRPFAVVFLERLGGTAFHISLLSALPGAVAALVLLPGTILFRRFTNKKRATAAFILISRSVLLALAFVPVLPAELRPLLFVVFVAVMNCPDSLSQTSLQSFLGTVFAGNLRGQAIALRTKFGQAVIPVVTIISGLIITFVPGTDEQRMLLYRFFFAGAFLVGLLEVFYFNKLKVPEYAAKEEAPKHFYAREQIVNIMKDKRFRAFFIPVICFAFTWQAGWPLFSIYQVIHLRANELWFAIYALSTGVAAFISGGFWQKLLRKRGNNTVLVLSGGMLAVNALIVPFVPNVQVMAVFSFFMGFISIGISTGMLNGVLEATPDENRMMYLAFYNTCMNISLFIAPFFAVLLHGAFGVFWALIIVGVLRIFGTFFVWWRHRGVSGG